ncbi:glycosyltransferase family 2 protein [Leifsonia sp. ZF2019]|uniref:glycosyltransferase n=1 Tax=Leifsonia sp. ZF2019 TaxID=2781978 RepID=UPI0021D9F994|nr:glycosyltransferase family 2 protein [Leifsonia sp. ZF2019]UAJ80051.1 glycosyltransferase family 2 protein [Leifsonia sp. ZF2019]
MLSPVLGAISLSLVVAFLFYVTSILVPFLGLKPRAPGDASKFEWHFMIPCRDEEAVIDDTLSRLRSNFADVHVWVIDDDSDDQTAQRVHDWSARDPNIHLVQRRRPQARTGKGDALNAAFHELQSFRSRQPTARAADETVVVVLDADGELERHALEYAASDGVFGDEVVGAAQVTVRMKNRGERKPIADGNWMHNAAARYLIRMQDLEFRTIIAAMQSLRGVSNTVGLGGNGQFTRLSALETIATRYGEPWHGSLLEDYELGVHVLLSGMQVRHIHESWVEQEGLTSYRRFFTQRTRWCQGNIQCARYIGPIARSPEFSNVGVLETAYYLLLPFLQLIGVAIWLYLGYFTISAISLNPEYWGSQAWVWIALVFVTGVLPFAIWGPVYQRRCERSASPVWGILWGLGVWLYVAYTYVTLARAFARIVLRRNGWAKTRRNAETLSGPVAKES